MRNLLLTALCVLIAVGASAQQLIKTDQLDMVKSISLSGKLSVEYIPADHNRIEVELFNSDIKRFNWTLNDGKLNIHLRPSSDAHANVKIWAKMDDLQEIAMNEGELICKSEIKTRLFVLSMSSSAKTTLKVSCIDLEVNASSNSVLAMSGQAKYLTLKASEKSRVDVRDLEATSVAVEATTGAEVYVTALERLVAFPKTGATIFYKGDPIIEKIKLSKMASMGASVHKIK